MFDFPNTPTLGQVATTPAGATFTWDGTKWVGGAGGGFLPLAGGVLTGPLSMTAAIPAGGAIDTIYCDVDSVGVTAYNLYTNAAKTSWLRKTAAPGGNLRYDYTTTNAFLFATTPTGAAGSAATMTDVASLTQGGDFSVKGVLQVNGKTVNPGAIPFSQSAMGGSGSAMASGMAGAALYFTPQSTTRLLVLITCCLTTTAAGAVGHLYLRYGTGTAPAAAAALTGTNINQYQFITGAASIQTGFALHAIASGLTIGTQYWFDVGADVNTGTCTPFNWFVTFLEV